MARSSAIEKCNANRLSDNGKVVVLDMYADLVYCLLEMEKDVL